MSNEKKLSLTREEVDLFFWMAGFSACEIPVIYKEAYDSLMRKLGIKKDD